ncbi:FAD-dependent oxidoreductase [Temperatibacter marinus]|uniref:FAD-dependent oxidoreductase n=1 Tax=Temperatibacter marinus TaxID=1456591 RepID=A0AA52EBY5_9PROT|nr:FAD-dependent oxidoreductase [Temperatibacter marinus]WND02552.1 FAD-dependent oxidoreductase [Temperatibacter marinus]
MGINNSDDTLWIAIIGAGPAGYYTAEALTKLNENARVDIIDRLPTPYGLIRAGVAPDHQSIKNVARRYESTNEQENVRFVGNLSLGRDITLKELLNLYDAVVLATGAAKDRELGIDGEALHGVYGSGAFVGWYNSHPDYADLDPHLDISSVAVIGNGNVAVDVARILAKTPAEMEGTDLARHAREAINASPIKDIYLIGRRGPLHAAFTPKELGELNKLENCVALLDPDDMPSEKAVEDSKGATKKNLAILKDLATNKPDDKPIRLHLKFFRRPMALLGEACVCGIRLETTEVNDEGQTTGTGESEVLPAGMVVSCIGYKSSPIEDIPYDKNKGRFLSDSSGKIAPGLYSSGWARRGPTGTIGTNKPDGVEVARTILNDIKPAGKQGRKGLNAIIKDRSLEIVTFENWKKIDEAEIDAALESESRHKFTNIDTMVTVAKSN